ncbi:Hsp20/alpha crystallin family protein [Geotoga petraea]|uniref:Hsp20/alpha crystallin family protein n=1 Tax=Geotoga petraea TaxID=28234 RepID=A0A4Z0W288_9BACT|nr:Hsp20/alpha crystallin family protein [Geotoga petraea]TGG88669.1 Hsp20/alpha crystallin family protein [Geotoga petraea]
MAIKLYRNFPEFSPFDFFEDFEKMMKGYEKDTFGKMSLDVYETDEAAFIEAELPGVKKDDININVEDGVLTISAEKNVEEEEQKGRKYYTKEIKHGSFKRSFEIPEYLNDEEIKAKFDKGILKIEIPRKEEEVKKNKKIDIE